MLKLLLDEHISPRVAEGLRRRHRRLAVHFLAGWENGQLLGQNDWTLLQHAAEEGLTLVTYDRRTIPLLLKTWSEEGRDHGGIIFIDDKTISPADIGAQVRALSELAGKAAYLSWTNRVCFLQR